MRDKRTFSILLVVGIGSFMSALDSSIINIVLPIIKEDFNVSLSMVEWIVTAYLLVISSLLLTFGRAADMYGHKKVYLIGFIIFTLGSLLCALSVNISMLIAFRLVQALGAGMLFATGPAIITNSVEPKSRGKALSVTAVTVALGLTAGPVIGGFLAGAFGWESIFFVNVPIGIIGIIMLIVIIPKDLPYKKEKFDIFGSLILLLALLFILVPLNISGDYDIPVYLFISLLAVGFILFAIFVMYEKRTKEPMLNIDLFKNRVFSASNLAALFIFIAQFIMVFLIPFYLQTYRGLSTNVAGLLYIPMPFATMLIAPISGAASDKFDSRYISSLGAFIAVAGFVMICFIKKDTSFIYLIISMMLLGTGFGMFQTPNNSAIMGNVPPQNRGTASGTLATMRNIGMAVGIALSGALFTFFEDKAKAVYKVKGLKGTVLFENMFITAFHKSIIIAVVFAVFAMVTSLVKGKVKTQAEIEQE